MEILKDMVAIVHANLLPYTSKGDDCAEGLSQEMGFCWGEGI